MDPDTVLPLVRAYRRLLEQAFGERLRSVRLFGSRARGDASPESDVDVAVVVAGLTDDERVIAIDLAYTATREQHGPLISPLVWSEVEQAERKTRERRLALDIEREGIPV